MTPALFPGMTIPVDDNARRWREAGGAKPGGVYVPPARHFA
jgi:hypothetical protein